MKKLLPALVLISLGSLFAQDNKPKKAKITEYGVFKINTIQVMIAPGEHNTKINRTGDPILVNKVDTIIPKIGLRFGYRYKVEAPLNDQITRFTMIIKHPPIQSPDDEKPRTETIYEGDVKDGNGYVGFCFDDKWEMIPGKWNLAVRLKEEEFCNMTFTVLPAEK